MIESKCMAALISEPAFKVFFDYLVSSRSAWVTGDPVSTKQSIGILSLQDRFRFSLSFDILEISGDTLLSNCSAFSWTAIHTENHLRRGSSGTRSDSPEAHSPQVTWLDSERSETSCHWVSNFQHEAPSKKSKEIIDMQLPRMGVKSINLPLFLSQCFKTLLL